MLPAGAAATAAAAVGAVGAVAGAELTGAVTATAAPPPIAAFNAATLANPILVAASSGVSQVTLVPTLLTSGSAKHRRVPQVPTMNLPPTHWENPPLTQALGSLAGSQGELAERLLKLLFRLMASGMLWEANAPPCGIGEAETKVVAAMMAAEIRAYCMVNMGWEDSGRIGDGV